MGVATHLGIRLADYDKSIRRFIPHYEEMLEAAAQSVATLSGRRPLVVDLGTGTGALADRVLRACRDARITGIDADSGMLAMATKRLHGRLTATVGDFLSTPLPRCNVVTASLALHHIATRARKTALYAKCYRALSADGVLVNADCCLSSSARLQARDRKTWHAHLARSYGARSAHAYLRAWAKEDFYFTMDDEREMLARAGFAVDVVWRRDSFAVMVALKQGAKGA